jgi:hypothetical protein
MRGGRNRQGRRGRPDRGWRPDVQVLATSKAKAKAQQAINHPGLLRSLGGRVFVLRVASLDCNTLWLLMALNKNDGLGSTSLKIE